MTKFKNVPGVFLLIALGILGGSNQSGATEPAVKTFQDHQGIPYVAGELIVRFQDVSDPTRIQSLVRASQVLITEDLQPLVPELGLYLVKTRPTENSMFQLADQLETLPEVKYVVPNYVMTLRSQTQSILPRDFRERRPNDPEFGKLWSLKNPGSTVDIQATRAWELGQGGKDYSGNEVVIAVVDGGVDVTHPDLAENIWTNPGEIEGNGKDDDGNGYVDDVHGWNAYSSNGSVPAHDHGTHVAGIAGAQGDNNRQITGVNWNVKIMGVAGAASSTATVSAAYGYVIKQKKLWLETKGAKGANVVVTNSSFGVDRADCTLSQYRVWDDLYNEMGKLGILSAAATINAYVDIDAVGDVPTGCSSEYIVSVTNTNRTDIVDRAGFGRRGIDLGAPGTGILSTVPGSSLSVKTGTSMATPHVAGAVALMHSLASRDLNELYLNNPSAGALKFKELILKATDSIASLVGKSVTGGRLNLFQAVKSAHDFAR